MTPAVKVCGLTRPEEAAMLTRHAVEYAGTILFFPKSKRYITTERAREILAALPPQIRKVAVTVSPTVEQVREIESMGYDFLQVHGKLSGEVLAEGSLPILRAYNIADQSVLLEEHPRIVGYVLDGAKAGSGRVFDWEKEAGFDRRGKLLVLAGGLNPENVAEGIRFFQPDVVDVSSGVEGPEGKDEEKIRRFVAAVRCAEASQD